MGWGDVGLSVGVGEADDSANILTLQHVSIAFVDLVQSVAARDHVLDVKLPCLVHRQQIRDVEVRVSAAKEAALQVLLHQGHHGQVQRDIGVQQAAHGGEYAGSTLRSHGE